MSPENELARKIDNPELTIEHSQRLVDQIWSEVLAQSKTIHKPDFETISPGDLQLLFDLYDNRFFDGRCGEALGRSSLTFRISSRMTRAGGKTTRITPRRSPSRPQYEIAVSSTLLFETFDTVDRTVLVTGLECRNRLEALQRIFEHELTHLIELLVWNQSSCAKKRFQNLASRFFNHKDYRHELVTPREKAFKLHGVKTGSRVQFKHEGVFYEGVVNRITKRATVLVQDRKGRRYSDNKRYLKFYVPVEELTLIQ